jgi:hypothetical protein
VIITGITVALRRLLGASLTVAFKLTGLASADEQQQVNARSLSANSGKAQQQIFGTFGTFCPR